MVFSIGLELISDLPDVDVILVSCGGGGLLSGVAAAVRLSGYSNCRVYGVEPEQANTMWRSFQEGHAVSLPGAKSIAAGLAPPFAGDITYSISREFVTDILLVSDEEISRATISLNKAGFKAEPSGAAGLAALRRHRATLAAAHSYIEQECDLNLEWNDYANGTYISHENVSGTNRPMSVSLIISGSNISDEDYIHLCQQYDV